MKRKVEQTYDDKEIITNTLSKMILKVFDNIKNNKDNKFTFAIYVSCVGDDCKTASLFVDDGSSISQDLDGFSVVEEKCRIYKYTYYSKSFYESEAIEIVKNKLKYSFDVTFEIQYKNEHLDNRYETKSIQNYPTYYLSFVRNIEEVTSLFITHVDIK